VTINITISPLIAIAKKKMMMTNTSEIRPGVALRRIPANSFVSIADLPGDPSARRKAMSRAAADGELIRIRRGLYYRGTPTRYGMTGPSAVEVAFHAIGTRGVGPTGYSAAREWGVTTQIPAKHHVATLRKAETVPGVAQVMRSNLARVDLTPKEIALLELLRDPETYVESGWNALVDAVGAAAATGLVRVAHVVRVARGERDVATRRNMDRLLHDLERAAG